MFPGPYDLPNIHIRDLGIKRFIARHASSIWSGVMVLALVGFGVIMTHFQETLPPSDWRWMLAIGFAVVCPFVLAFATIFFFNWATGYKK